MKVQSFLYVPVHEISWPCDVSKVVKHSIENWTSCFQLLTSANWKVAVQTALYSLCLAPIELHIEVSGVRTFHDHRSAKHLFLFIPGVLKGTSIGDLDIRPQCCLALV